MTAERQLTSSLLVLVNVATQLDPTGNIALATVAADTRTFGPEVPQLNDSVIVVP